ncbi:hypothetical protein C2E23DRAFT_885353 [Lenzites betulinus]|nr:hypothetical protein C2E23DRAFT_885353 [Lenzites betulinus]
MGGSQEETSGSSSLTSQLSEAITAGPQSSVARIVTPFWASISNPLTPLPDRPDASPTPNVPHSLTAVTAGNLVSPPHHVHGSQPEPHSHLDSNCAVEGVAIETDPALVAMDDGWDECGGDDRLVKTHFYHIWVQLRIFRRSREIRRMHEILAQVVLPSKLGRLPRLIGEPAGGSLTADQWLILATVVGPLALPDLWQEIAHSNIANDSNFFQIRREAIRSRVARRKAQGRAKKRAHAVAHRHKEAGARLGPGAQARRSMRIRIPTEKAKDLILEPDDAGAELDDDDNGWDASDDDDEHTANGLSKGTYLHERDLLTFLKLCSALRLLLSDTMTEEQVVKADTLIREYCQELVELYGADVIRPNHHYATHTPEFVRDYGPLRGFWTFIFERLNKILKGYHTNNHDGGEIECTFFREYCRAGRLQRLLAEGLRQPIGTMMHQSCSAMRDAVVDGRGTLQQLTEELEEVYNDGM